MDTPTCTPRDAYQALQSGALMLDVREYPEWAASHVSGATLLPLGRLKSGEAALPHASEIYLLCRSGRRATEAAGYLRETGIERPVVVEGGIEAWKNAGLPVRSRKGPISLERQVRIAAGSLVLLGLFVPRLRPISYFVGAGLVFAGITDYCGMALLLAKLPWNQDRTGACSSAVAPAPQEAS